MDTSFFPFGQMISMFKVDHGWLFERVMAKLSSNRHTILVGEEGWAEKEYVKELGFQLTEKHPDIHCCYIDCRQVYSREAFLDQWVRTLQNRFPGIFDRLDSGKLDSERWEEEALAIPFTIAKKKKIRLVIFFTSCHLLHRIPDRVYLLRKLIWLSQKNPICTYCFFGKKTPEFMELVEPPGPLCRFRQFHVIGEKQLVDPSISIRKLFHDHQKEIGQSLSVHLRHLVDNHPFYLTLLTWHTLIRTDRICTREHIRSALNDILLHYDPSFNQMAERLTDRQLHLLKAIVEGHHSLHSESVRREYGQGSSGSVSRTIKILKSKELIEYRYNEYVFVDPLFRIWLQEYFHKVGP